MSEISAKSFLGLLQKSKLCENAELKASLSELSRQSNGKPIKLDQLTTHLLDAGLISEWHIKKLVNGKYKGFFLGKYKLLRLLGTGGMSTVYLAQHTIFDQQRAIKVLPRDRVADRSYLERFFREGRAAAALNDKNIVRVYDIGNEGDTHYLVMEYVKGQDIYQLVNENGPLPFDLAIDYMIQGLTGLQYAHDRDLVHRDVKPANLLVTEDGLVKLLDLGLALFQEDDSSLTVMHNERVLGTADYLSPEQAVDSHNLDHRSDIYSAGCTLYFMLTGKPPFFEGSLAQRIAKHQSCEPQPISDFRPDCPEELSQLVKRMMKKNPSERFQSCEDAIVAFRAVSEILLLNGSRHTPSIAVEKVGPAAPEIAVPSIPAEPVQPTQPRAKGQPKAKAQPKAKVQAAIQPKAGRTPATKPVEAGSVAAKRLKQPSSKKPTPDSQAANAKVGKNKGVTAKPASKPTEKQAKPTQPNRKPVAVKSKKDSSAGTPTVQQRPAAQASKTASRQAKSKQRQTVSVGRKPAVEATSVSVVISGGEAMEGDKSIVGDQALTQFVNHSRGTSNQTARPKRNPVKNQLLVTGMVIGMLALLGLVILIAMWFGST